MPRSVVRYDKDLPEIEDHNPFRPPTGYLVKDPEAEAGYRAEPGRRPSQLLLTNKLRAAVDHWRAEGYPGASEVTRRLFNYWFEEEHPTTKEVFRFYFAQQEAIETLAHLVEIDRIRDAFALVQRYGDINYPPGKQMSLDEPWKLQVTSSGQRQIERFFPEVGQTGVQPLPPEGLSRFAFKMATGSGKTVVMAMAIVWSYFHKRMIPGSPLSTNFLVSAPNIIVYQRLEKDFGSNRIFAELPLVPPEWSFGLKVILRGESTEPDAGGNLFLTNIQQVYESRGQAGTPLNPVDAILGRRPIKDLASQQRPILGRIKQLRDLVVINDEAHHVHDEELEWAKTLIGIHESLPSGLSLWLDFTATPKFQDGSYYPWCIVDYPLAQAVEDRIVKAPIIVERVTQDDPTGVTKANITHKYKEWVYAALERYRDHERQYRAVGVRPVLFIMCEKSVYADALGGWLVATKEFKLKKEEVLVIHTDTKGEITQADLEKARQFARDVDSPTSRVKVIVSVMMLREGWDVRNVSVILGLRPFTAQANILPEQAVGRGLRLMHGIGPDRTQTLEVMGTKAFEGFVRELEKEGVGIETRGPGQQTDPIWIEPLKGRLDYDIAIPLTEPVLHRRQARLDELDPLQLDSIFDRKELEDAYLIRLKLQFAQLGVEVGEVVLSPGPIPESAEILSSLTSKVEQGARLEMAFASLYPKVRLYVEKRCFGKKIDLEKEGNRAHLNNPLLQEKIAAYLVTTIGGLTVEAGPLEFKRQDHRLSETRAFQWRRDLTQGPLRCKKTVFNFVATYNPYERRFAQFLDHAEDILRFASLGATQQGDAAAQFRVDYLKPSGAIGFYHPDFVAVQKAGKAEVNWILETKGRVWEDTEAKDAAVTKWCTDVSKRLKRRWEFRRVNEPDFRAAQKEGVKDVGTLLSRLSQSD